MLTSGSQPNLASGSADEIETPLRLWAMVALTGIGAGLTSGLLMRLLRLVQHLSFAYSAGDFLTGVRNTSATHRLLVVILAGVFLGLSLYLFHRFARNTGPGITGAIWHRQGVFEAAPTVVQSLISIVAVGMGAAVGREAALKDVGATVAAKLCDWTNLTPAQRRLLVACGAGAGMAAAYNVPLGGALFTVEVLLGSLSIVNALAAIITSFTAVAVSWLMLPNAPTFTTPPLTFSPSILLWAVMAGPLLGAASALYVRLFGWAERGRPKGPLAIAAPILVFLLLGLAAMRFPEILGKRKERCAGDLRNPPPARASCLAAHSAAARHRPLSQSRGSWRPIHTYHDLRGSLGSAPGRGVESPYADNPKGQLCHHRRRSHDRFRLARTTLLRRLHAGADQSHRHPHRPAPHCCRRGDPRSPSYRGPLHLLDPGLEENS